MRKTFLGLAVIAAIATPFALATSAQAAPVLSDAANCTPIFPKDAVTHPEYKYTRADGKTAHNTEWSAKSQDALTINSINYVRARPAVVNVVVDTPAVVGVTCVDAGANVVTQPGTVDAPGSAVGISGANATIDGGLESLDQTPGVHTAHFTANPGHLFSANGTAQLMVDYTIDPQIAQQTRQFSYTDDFGPVTCDEAQYATYDSVSCTLHGPTPLAPKETGTHPWLSDFNGTSLGTLTYTVNDEGTGYTGKVVYPTA